VVLRAYFGPPYTFSAGLVKNRDRPLWFRGKHPVDFIGIITIFTIDEKGRPGNQPGITLFNPLHQGQTGICPGLGVNQAHEFGFQAAGPHAGKQVHQAVTSVDAHKFSRGSQQALRSLEHVFEGHREFVPGNRPLAVGIDSA
jgi:hypothetical protein